MHIIKPKIGIAIDEDGVIVEIASEGSFAIYDPEVDRQVWVDEFYDMATWRIGDTVTLNEDGTFKDIAHRSDNEAEIELKENIAKPAKWKAKLRTLITKMKDGSATMADVIRGLKICMFLLGNMVDEDDE